jgi:hypothetical protein
MKFLILKNRLFCELDCEPCREFANDACDRIPGIVTQMTTGFSDQYKTFCSHDPRIIPTIEEASSLWRHSYMLEVEFLRRKSTGACFTALKKDTAAARLSKHAQKIRWQILPLNRTGLIKARRRAKRQAKAALERGQ